MAEKKPEYPTVNSLMGAGLLAGVLAIGVMVGQTVAWFRNRKNR